MAHKDFNHLFVGGRVFPDVPFQMTITNRKYCKRYSLPFQTMLTITQVRYSIKHKQIRYSLLDALFDFPWDEEACETIDLFLPN